MSAFSSNMFDLLDDEEGGVRRQAKTAPAEPTQKPVGAKKQAQKEAAAAEAHQAQQNNSRPSRGGRGGSSHRGGRGGLAPSAGVFEEPTDADRSANRTSRGRGARGKPT